MTGEQARLQNTMEQCSPMQGRGVWHANGITGYAPLTTSLFACLDCHMRGCGIAVSPRSSAIYFINGPPYLKATGINRGRAAQLEEAVQAACLAEPKRKGVGGIAKHPLLIPGYRGTILY